MYCRKTPSYGDGAYAKPINRAEKVGYQAPREDVSPPSATFPARQCRTFLLSRPLAPPAIAASFAAALPAPAEPPLVPPLPTAAAVNRPRPPLLCVEPVSTVPHPPLPLLPQVARPFKAKAYNDPYVGTYSVFKGKHYKGHANTSAGPAVSPLKTSVEREAAFSIDPTYGPAGARVPTDRKDARLQAARGVYGTGEFKGKTALKPGGGTYAITERPRPGCHPTPPAKPHYGGGHYTQDFSITHPDADGFQNRLHHRQGQVAQLTPKPDPSRGMRFASDPIPSNPYKHGTSELSEYGGGMAVSPAVKNRHDANPGVAGVHYGARMGGSRFQPYFNLFQPRFNPVLTRFRTDVQASRRINTFLPRTRW